MPFPHAPHAGARALRRTFGRRGRSAGVALAAKPPSAAKLKGLIAPAIAAVRRGDPGAAFTAYDEFLRALEVYGTRTGEAVRVVSPWAHTLTDDQIQSYNQWLGTYLLPIRSRLQRAAHPRPGEMARLEDIEWDLWQVREGFVDWITPFFRDESDEFAHDPFKIVLTTSAVSEEGGRSALAEAMETLDLAAAKIRPKFPKVLYGKVYVVRGLKGNEAGSYVPARDSINLRLYVHPDRTSAMSLIHEFGHRYHTRFLDGDQRARFIRLSTEGDYEVYRFSLGERRALVDEYIALLKRHRREDYPENPLSKDAKIWFHNYPRAEWRTKVVPLLQRFRDEGDDSVEGPLREALGMYWLGGSPAVETNKETREPVSASFYGATSWEENFAESFLHFVIGKALPAPLQRFMEAL
jgi:hypothetical protein